MPTEPSIKGSALVAVIDDLCRLRDSGRLSEERLEARLEVVDLELLGTKIQSATWYPIASYQRLCEVLLDIEGRGSLQYIVDRGARAAERLWEAGLYIQLQHGEEKAEQARRNGSKLTERDARLVTSLSGAIFNFTEWAYLSDEGEARIVVTKAQDLPDLSVLAARGFLEYVISRLRGRDTSVDHERPTPDRVVFRFPTT